VGGKVSSGITSGGVEYGAPAYTNTVYVETTDQVTFEAYLRSIYAEPPSPLTMTQGDEEFELTFDGYGWRGAKQNAITPAQYAVDFTARYIKRKKRAVA
jgi:hypothetical protein